MQLCRSLANCTDDGGAIIQGGCGKIVQGEYYCEGISVPIVRKLRGCNPTTLKCEVSLLPGVLTLSSKQGAKYKE